MINTLIIISIAYCFILFESIAIFLFINDYIKNLFFYNNCRESIVVLDDFAACLTVAITKKRVNLYSISENLGGTIAMAGMDVAWELSS